MRLFFFILVCVPCLSVAQTNLKSGQVLKKAQALYAAGKWDQVIELGLKLASSENVDDLVALAQTEALVAQCYFQRNEMKSAEDQLRNILFIKPTFELSAFETPKPLLEIFEKLKKELALKSKELQQVKESADQRVDVIETTTVVRKMSGLAPLLPFGAAQFEYGSKLKGILIATGEGLALAGNIASYWTKRSLRFDSGNNGYNIAQVFQFASIALFVAIYAFGFVDGFVHRHDTVQESSKTESRKISKEEFLQKLDSIKKKGS
jgi:hypothetical protein